MQLRQLGSGLGFLFVLTLTGCSGSDARAGGVEATLGGASTEAVAGASQGGANTAASGGNRATIGGAAMSSSNAATGGKSNQGGAGGGGTTVAAAGAAAVAADCRKEGDNKTTLVFVNHCAQSINYRGSDIAGGVVGPGAFACVDVGNATDAINSKRYWGYTGSDPGAEHYSLAEFTFNTDFYDMDWYNISYVDAFNLPLAIVPSARPKCRQLSCPQDFLSVCPAEGQYRDASGQVVSCVSPNRDDPHGAVVQLFEQCNDAYAWSGDDQKGSDPSPMIGCEVEDFDIVFCPGAT